jgi:phage terminase small subunit
VSEYLKDSNATQAAIRCGYSAKSANVNGPRLLVNAGIAAAIAEAQAKRLGRLDITADRVLREVANLAFSDVRAWFDENGALLPIHELPDNVAAALGSIEVQRQRTTRGEEVTVEEHVIKVKAWDKVRSLDMLMRHLALYKDKLEHSGDVTFTPKKVLFELHQS